MAGGANGIMGQRKEVERAGARARPALDRNRTRPLAIVSMGARPARKRPDAKARLVYASSSCCRSFPRFHEPNVSSMNALQFVVEGGHRLSGTIRPSGTKNAALPIIAAALLTDKPVVLRNVPRIRDVETLVELVK